MRVRCWLPSLLTFACVLFGVRFADASEDTKGMPLGHSTLAVVASVRADGPAARAGLKPGDVVVSLNRTSNPPLEALLAHRYEAENHLETNLGVKRGASSLVATLGPGNWGCEFRADLSRDALKRYESAEAALDSDRNWEAGQRDWEALAEDCHRTGWPEISQWLRLELGKALRGARRWHAARTCMTRITSTPSTIRYWGYAATIQIAHTYRAEGHLEQAAAFYVQARNQAQASGSERRVAGALTSLFGFEWDRGRLAEARNLAEAYLALQERLDPGSLGVAASYNSLGAVASAQGDLVTGRRLMLQALAIQQRHAPNGQGAAFCYNNLGNGAFDQGDLAAAREYYLQAFAILERLSPDSHDVSLALNNLGNVARELGELKPARDYLTRALQLQERKQPDSLALALTLNNLGETTARLGDLTAAQAMLRRALLIRERLAPEGLDAAWSLQALGDVARDLGDLNASRESHTRALGIRERLAPNSFFVAESLRGLAKTEARAGQGALAKTLFARAVDALEAQRARVGGEASKSSFTAVHQAFYSDLIAAYLDADQPEKALETLERSRARAFLEMLATRSIDLKGELPEALRNRQEDLARLRRTLSGRLAKASLKTNPKDVEAWRSELLRLPQQEDALAEEIRKASPRLAALMDPKPLSFSDLVKTLEVDSLLLAYAVGEKESYLFTLRRIPGKATRPAFKTFRLPFGKQALEARVKAFRELLGPKAALGSQAQAWKSAARELFATLLAPAARDLDACRRIVLLPDGPLHLLPFGALIPGNGSRPLGFRKPIRIEPSMTAYRELKAENAAKTRRWTGFGDPLYAGAERSEPLRGALEQLKTRGFALGPLPGTREEVTRIAGIFGPSGQVRLGGEATKASVRDLARSATYLHFACHGVIDSEFPMHSALALSPDLASGDDGLFQAWEIIQDLKLDADCVVLSACETGLGRIQGGEGILGLTRAFFYAGARSTVVSLWPISDESTSTLMEAFYREILAGAPRDLALLRAQRSLARHPAFAHPFFWAAFGLHGRAD